jgi:hypothetical protein
MFHALALMGLSVLTASAQTPAVAVVPAIASIPVIARLATAKRLPMPACDGAVLVHKKNEIVCAVPGIDWSAYGKIEVAEVRVVSADAKRPLTDQEVRKLTNAFRQSLQRRFGAGSDNRATARTLRIRAEVVNVSRTNTALNIFTLAAIQSPVSFGGTSTHFELSDGDSGLVLAKIDLSGRGRLYDAFSSTRTLGHAQKVLGRMPKQLDSDVKTLRRKSNAVETAALQSPGSLK